MDVTEARQAVVSMQSSFGNTQASGPSAAAQSQRWLLYVVDWLPPDFGPTGQYAALVGRELASAGRKVHLIGLTAGRPGTQREVFARGGELRITRLASYAYDKSRYVSRLSWLIRMNCKIVREILRDSNSRRADVLFTGSPPFMLFFILPLKWLRGARLIYRITDFYPEVIIAELGGKSFLLSIIQRLTWAARRRVDEFQALGEDQRRLLIAGGIAPERIVLKRDTSPVQITGREPAADIPAALAGYKILLYSGNYGVAHDVDTVVDGLIGHHREGGGRFALWLNAFGVAVDRIEQRLRAADVPLARTKPVPLDNLPSLLVAADAHLITLRSGFSGIVLPSKVYACIATQRPVIFVGPEDSDVHLLCSSALGQAYRHVNPGDARGFARALEDLSA